MGLLSGRYSPLVYSICSTADCKQEMFVLLFLYIYPSMCNHSYIPEASTHMKDMKSYKNIFSYMCLYTF